MRRQACSLPLVSFVSLFSFVALLHPSPLAAQTPDDPIAALRGELDDLRRQYEERLGALDRRLTELETENAALREAAAATEAPLRRRRPPPSPPPVAGPTGDATQTSNYFNPAMSVIGNFLGVAGRSGDGEELPSAELRESEISLQAVIDPYARADLFLAFGEEGVEVEEGFVTLTALPANLLAKVGRMRAGFGKVNTLHLHLLPWPDQPLPLVNLLGGEEGWIGTGVSLAGSTPASRRHLLRGDAPGLRRRERAVRARASARTSPTTSTTASSAISATRPTSTSASPGRTDPTASTPARTPSSGGSTPPIAGSRSSAPPTNGLVLRGEVYRSRRDQVDSIQHAIGWFASGEYQLARRWSTGARYEWSERADDETLHDRGEAVTLTFSPSEFSQLRGEYRRRHFAEDVTSDELLLQLQFAIGAHGAHPF